MDWITAYSYFRMAVPAGWRIRIEQGESTAWCVIAYDTLIDVKMVVRLPDEMLYCGDVEGVKILARRLAREIHAWGHVPPMVDWRS